MKPALLAILLATTLSGCDSHLWENPNENVDPPTVIYRVTATPDTVAPGGWVRLRCVVRDSLDPTITYFWDNASLPDLQVLPRTAEILVQAPYDSPTPFQRYYVEVGRNGSSGVGVAQGHVSFAIRQP